MPDGSDPRFVAGGTLHKDSLVYARRRFEDVIFEQVTSGDWVLLLGPRQHGKSSALVRLYRRLSDAGYFCAFVDLQRYGVTTPMDMRSFLAGLPRL